MSALPSEVFLQTGEFWFGAGHVRVHTMLGTCVAIVMWHPQQRVGGMCHYMLPKRGSGASGPQEAGFYAEEVIVMFDEHVRRHRTRPQDYVVKVFGGGRMFVETNRQRVFHDASHQDCDRCPDVACKNIRTGRELLAAHGYVIAGEHMGGSGSRRVVLDVWSGDVWLQHSGQVLGQAESA